MSKFVLLLVFTFFSLVAVSYTIETLGLVVRGEYSQTTSLAQLKNSPLLPGKNSKVYVSQGYGRTQFAEARLVGKRHNGIDLAAKLGTPILSPTKGKVVTTGNQELYCPRRGYGKFVIVESDEDDVFLLFAHLSKISVKESQDLDSKEKIGEVGRTGLATAPHLHLSVFKKDGFYMNQKSGCGPNPKGKDVNPIPYLESLK
ncbi:MAG: M23 family metallopeptidase [Patescibacteria group bacterium]